MTLLSNIASENTLWLIASPSRKFAIFLLANRLEKKMNDAVHGYEIWAKRDTMTMS